MNCESNQKCPQKSVILAIMSRMWESLTRLLTAPVIIIARIVFWMSGGRINWSFGQTRIPDGGICSEVVPLALYARDAHGIPYRNCRNCYSEKTAREYTERKNAKAKAGGDATGGKPYNR